MAEIISLPNVGRRKDKREKFMSNELTQWHSAFCSAIKLELVDYKNDLDYLSELGLNSKPILIDLLVITKSEDTSKKT